jgi:Lectin C-type domain
MTKRAARKTVVSFLTLLAVSLQACMQETSDVPDGSMSGGSVAVSVQALSPDTSCALYSSAGRDYWFCDTERTWALARSKCQLLLGFDLVTINDATENSFVRSHVTDDSWIGANDMSVEGAWRWAQSNTQFWQGTYSGSAVLGAYSNWASFQPNSSSEDCAIIDDASTAKWSDVSCSGNREYVCEGVVDGCGSVQTVGVAACFEQRIKSAAC